MMELARAATTKFARGWAWLALDADNLGGLAAQD
jgi:hypothetical protein